jgi:hypothetical protein
MTATAVVRPLPGSGLVTRSGDLLLVCADGAAGVEELLGLVAEVAAAGGDGSVLIRRVAALLAADFSNRYPACAACGPTGEGRLAVLVYGNATATVGGGDGEVMLHAADAIGSVNRLVPGPITGVRLELPGAGSANPLARLEAGVITAAGVVVGDGAGAPMNAPAQAGPPAPESVAAEVAWSASSMMDSEADAGYPAFPATIPPPDEPPPPAPASLEEPAMADQMYADEPYSLGPFKGLTELREPDPTAPHVAVALDATSVADAPFDADPRITVLGLRCANGHLNDPAMDYCAVCGDGMRTQAQVLQEGPRPPLGALLIDDGSTYRLDVDYVLGREPQHDPEVVSGAARPLKITDAEGVVSRRHIRVALVGWEVQVVDLGSANGTFVQLPGEAEARQIAAHQPVTVSPGTVVTMGRRWFRFEPMRTG